MPASRFARYLFFLMLLAAGGCRPESSDADGRIRVRFMILLISTKQVEHYRWAEATYEARHPDVDIVIDQFPGSSLKDFEIKLRLQFASGNPPDAFHVHEDLAARFAGLGLLDPAPSTIQHMVQANSLNDMIQQAPSFGGRLYGIVNEAVWTVLYYNRTMFRQAGLDPDAPPRTWDELVDDADRLTVRDEAGHPIRAGLSLRTTGYKPGIAEKWLTFLYSAGGHPFSSDGTHAAFDTQAGRDALGLYRTILFDRRIDSPDLEGDQQGFGQERVAMFIRELHVVRWLKEHYPDLDFGTAPIPALRRSVSAGGSYLFVVSQASKHKVAAWDFIRFLMSDEAYSRYVGIGGVLPTTRSVAAMPQFRDDPHLRTFFDQKVAPPSGIPGADRARAILGAYLERFCYGHLTVDETLRRAARDVDAVLAPNRSR